MTIKNCIDDSAISNGEYYLIGIQHPPCLQNRYAGHIFIELAAIYLQPLNFNLMGLNYKSLDNSTRQKMLEEVNYDIRASNLYLSKRFTPNGGAYYQQILPNHIQNGNDDSLAQDLKNNNSFLTHEDRKTANGISKVKVPETASQTFSEGEFNRFYLRGLCLRAIAQGKRIIIYRGRFSENPRSESEAKIGMRLDANKLLNDLRTNTGVDTALGLPPGPNSGLTGELVD